MRNSSPHSFPPAPTTQPPTTQPPTAAQVGPSGRVAGFDTRSYCVELAEDNTARLRDTSPDYAAAACEAEFERHNAFLPSSKYRGRFNKARGEGGRGLTGACAAALQQL